MKLRVSLFRHLEILIDHLGGPAPELVLKESTSENIKVVISLDVSKIPRPSAAVILQDPHLFSGDDPSNASVAEHKAVMSVIKFLEENFSLEIHDLSYSKLKKFESDIVDLVSRISSLNNRLLCFMRQYQSSVNLLLPIISSSSKDPSSVINGNSKSLSDLCNCSQSCIACIEQQLEKLAHKMSIYQYTTSMVHLIHRILH